MFAIFALVCFLLALFHAAVGLNLVTLGLAFIALHLIAGSWGTGTIIPSRRQ